MRVAIYFTPAQDDPLTQNAAHWLGRDAFDGKPTRGDDPESDAIVADPARYGFHATLKAPFHLAAGKTLAELNTALASFSSTRAGISLGPLSLTRIGSFLALTPHEKSDALAALEADVRTAFEPFRASLTEAEIARRRPDKLSTRQRQNLEHWGYPHVGPDFRFHMTLTGPIDETALGLAENRLRAQFGDLLDRAVVVDALSLFVEPEPRSPFLIHTRHKLRVPAYG
ncbi:DUF1045 domain-containing protein [Mesorhizobium sp. SB112]|uniref:DUF1045 domain-containing protein n=1 Tax=Mesorhizobium sp. SB112 TaxID=3151853 RepID=UPI003266167B